MNDASLEVYNFIKGRFKLPENIVSLNLVLTHDARTRIVCEFYPEPISAEQALKDYLRG